jgi:hypothetical protein
MSKILSTFLAVCLIAPVFSILIPKFDVTASLGIAAFISAVAVMNDYTKQGAKKQ